MYSKNCSNDYGDFPFIVVENGVITNVNKKFANMTEYVYEELLNKNIEDLLYDLRVGPSFDIENINDKADYFLFSKSLKVKFVNIKVIQKKREKVYCFIGKADLNLDVRFPFLSSIYSDNYYGIGIYNMPDMTLLKANERYISFMDEPFNRIENCIGRHIGDFLTGFKDSTYKKLWKNVIDTGKVQNIDKYMYQGLKRGITYWRISLVPIFEENKMIYCVAMITEITEEILHEKSIEKQSKIIEEQKKSLEAIIESSSDGLFIFNKDNSVTFLNDEARKFVYNVFEYKQVGDSCSNTEYFDKHGKPLNLGELPGVRAMNGEKIKDFILTAKRPDKIIHYRISASPMYDSKGNVVSAFLCASDITDLINNEKKIVNQKEQLEAIIDNISEELYIIDKDRNYIMFNSAARERYSSYQFNNSNEYMNKIKLLDLSGNEIEFDNTPIAKLAKGEFIRNEIVMVNDPNKRYVCSNGKPIFDDEGELIAGVMLSQDITERILQEQRIKYHKEQLEAIIENMSDGVIVLDKESNPILLNAEARKNLPYLTSKTLLGIKEGYKYSDLDGNPFTFEKYVTTRAYNGEKVKNERVVITGPDKHYIIEMNASPIFDDEKNVVSIVLSFREITEQMKQQQQLLDVEREKSEAMEKAIEMKDEFLSMISHEFRTPINVISTAIQAMSCIYANELTDNLKRYLNTIRQNTFRQIRLVNNLLDITRADAGRIKIHKANRDIVFLTNSIVESVSTYATQKGIEITFKSSITKKIIGIDDEKYERILLNLLSNAIKFTPKGKLISVKLRTMKNKIQIEVKDSGIGIPEDKINLIFERFGQVDSSLSRQAEGSGIGLSLVKRLVRVLDGNICVKSKVGKGSSFIIELPSEKVMESSELNIQGDLLGNRLVNVTTVEFSDIYL